MKGGWDAEDQARHSGACSLTQREKKRGKRSCNGGRRRPYMSCIDIIKEKE